MEVRHAEHGRAALELLEREPAFDVVLMDVMMPEMDGYETIGQIRQDPKLRSLPIIAVTAKALKDDRDRCIQSGATDYMPKPVDADKLVEKIRLWVR
jgi:CheY-like chemotaxis protein